jgi:hypothetical protein
MGGSTMNERAVKLLVAAIPLAALLTGCEPIVACKPTKTEAKDAAVAEVRRPLDSAVLEARLTSGGHALRSETIEFIVDDNGAHIGEATTTATGIARLDLKRDPTSLIDPVRGGRYRAVFHGDVEYCRSQDAATFRLARA